MAGAYVAEHEHLWRFKSVRQTHPMATKRVYNSLEHGAGGEDYLRASFGRLSPYLCPGVRVCVSSNRGGNGHSWL